MSFLSSLASMIGGSSFGPAEFDALRAEHPESAWHLLRAVALQIDMNLRLANAAIASYEE